MPRADARTNRARILAAADEVFAEGGETASTEEVARRADVGIATVFRHFPTKVDLLEAVLVNRLDRLRERADGMTEPRAFFDFFAAMVVDAPSKIAIGEALLATGSQPGPDALRAAEELQAAVGRLLERAKADGHVRSDAALPEVYAVLVGTCRAAAFADLDDAVRARMLAIVFDGLAPPDRRAPMLPRW
jgi:AcrR family transcriptional regulator